MTKQKNTPSPVLQPSPAEAPVEEAAPSSAIVAPATATAIAEEVDVAVHALTRKYKEALPHMAAYLDKLKGELNVSEGNISQILAVGKLDERVQKIVREGTKEPFKSFAASVVRELKRVSDPEVQVHFAQVAVEKNLSPSAVKFEIEKYLDKQQRATDGGGDKGEKGAKGSKGGRGVKLPEEVVAKDVKLVAKTDIVTLFNFSAATLAYERGRRDALAQVAGLVPLPTKAAESEE